MKNQQCILVIEDEKMFKNLLRDMLELEGFQVICAENGIEGLRCFDEHPVDLVITDILMPECEGIETIQIMKEKKPDIKIIAISGGGFLKADYYLYLAGKTGAICTLEKPFNRKTLIDKVHQMLTNNDDTTLPAVQDLPEEIQF
ncbi:MAG: response regulator [Desulfobacterales bacterium]|nr:response regulator [Desulfobacterales bacterium]